MITEIELIKDLRNKTMQSLLEKSVSKPGDDLSEIKMSITDFREILYEEARTLARRHFDKEFQE